MSFTAMRVLTSQPHPNADSLRVYELEAPGLPALVVIANLENVYQPGDVVAVARIGAVLEDGTTIRKARLRGVDSFGMLLGRVDDAPGTDLSARFASKSAPPPPEVPFVSWPSIELFHQMRAGLDALREAGIRVPMAMRYRAKVKLDGTNAAIHVLEGGRIAAQSRTQAITVEADNHGFAAWAHSHERELGAISARTGRAIVFGEWAGPGVQRRTAVASIDRKIFAVFAIQLGDPTHEGGRWIVEPARIAELLGSGLPDVFVLPWEGEAFALELADTARLQSAIDALNERVHAVEAEDPWVKATFGKSGLGEGFVLYPIDFETDERGSVDRAEYAPWLFKAKGEKHQVVRQKQPAQLEPEVAQSLDAFADLFVTEARVAQGIEAIGGKPLMPRMGDFLKWMAIDVEKESATELAASGLTWKQVAKAVQQRARDRFLALAKR